MSVTPLYEFEQIPNKSMPALLKMALKNRTVKMVVPVVGTLIVALSFRRTEQELMDLFALER